MEEQSKKHNIIAITDGTSYGAAAVAHAECLSAIFNASLTVITQTATKYFRHSKLNEIHALAHNNQTLMFVIGVAKRDKQALFTIDRAIRFIKPSRIPVMTVGNILPQPNAYKNVMLPLDIYRQTKEKSLWAGYFSRYYQATIHLIYGVYKDEFLKIKLQNNIDFTEKLYKNMDITYLLHPISQAIDNMDSYSLQYANKMEATLTVIMMTKYRSFFDFIAGVKERAVIANSIGLPVLCINERDDLYVLCT